MRQVWPVLLLFAWAVQTHAHTLSFDECLEGSEFILHAAMSRDSGVAREDFVGRMRADLMAIQKFPAELRWFAQDAEDEHFLITASEAVFDTPRPPDRHQNDFLRACVGRMSADAGLQADPGSEAAVVEAVKESGL